jgi:hypothetical protein
MMTNLRRLVNVIKEHLEITWGFDEDELDDVRMTKLDIA